MKPIILYSGEKNEIVFLREEIETLVEKVYEGGFADGKDSVKTGAPAYPPFPLTRTSTGLENAGK